MLAYVFWHRPAPAVALGGYEQRLAAFHAAVGVPSAAYRVHDIPWIPGGAGYEDWYLVSDWAALGALDEHAVCGERRAPHDAAAALAAWGAAGVYRLKHGRPDLAGTRFAAWRSKPAGLSYAAFEPTLPGRAVWQRQMVLGPTPEYVLHDAQPLAGDPAAAYAAVFSAT